MDTQYLQETIDSDCLLWALLSSKLLPMMFQSGRQLQGKESPHFFSKCTSLPHYVIRQDMYDEGVLWLRSRLE